MSSTSQGTGKEPKTATGQKSKGSWTPGPWGVTYNPQHYSVSAIQADSKPGEKIADLCSTYNGEDEEANARLIAAAPALLTILKEWERMIPRMADETPAEGSLRARTLTIIAHAEGRP